jgi:diketogulonate reductase-like aldo/keto reductase
VKVYAAADPKAANSPLEHPVVVSLAAKYEKTPAQVVLRWHIEHGLSAIPKSMRPARIAENIGIFDFTLAKEDVTGMDALETGVRGGPDPEIVTPKLFDLSIPDAS